MRDLTAHRPTRLRARFRRRRPRTLGQSLVEMALLAPVLLILLLGSLQVAYLGYGAVTIDTAAREAGRTASINLSALNSIAQGGNTYTCAADPTTDANPICNAVANNAGLLKGKTFSLVRITLNVTVAKQDTVPDDVQRVTQATCTGVSVSGVVSGIPSGSTYASVSDTLNGSGTVIQTDGSGNYIDCFNPNGSADVAVTISATAGTGGQCTGSSATVLSKSTGQWSATPSTVNLSLNCPTPTPTPAPTATPTPTATATASPTSSPTSSSTLPPVGSSPSAASCTTQDPPAGSFVTVDVQYQAGIFVPFLGNLLADSGKSYKTLHATVTVRVNPCTA